MSKRAAAGVVVRASARAPGPNVGPPRDEEGAINRQFFPLTAAEMGDAFDLEQVLRYGVLPQVQAEPRVLRPRRTGTSAGNCTTGARRPAARSTSSGGATTGPR